MAISDIFLIRGAPAHPAKKERPRSRFPWLARPARLLMSVKRSAIYSELKAIFASYPEIFFVQGGLMGLAFFAVTLVTPSVGTSGIIAVLSAYAFARFLKMDREFLRSGFYTYNPLLVGLSLGHLFQLTPLTCFLIASAGILTFIVAIAMASVFSRYLALPILSLPFVIVSWAAYLASHRYGNLLVAENYGQVSWLAEPDLPAWIAGYFKCFGAILFAPNVWVGAVVCALVLCQSRILFLLSLLGFYVGASTRALMFGSFNVACSDVNNFNFILIAMAVGGVYVVPSISSYVLATIAVTISTLVFDSIGEVCRYFHIPAFTLPFNLVSLAFLYLLALLQSPLYARFIGRTPEETIENEYANRMRYVGQLRTLFLPFSGLWKVWQGFSGQWTHQGAWRHAYDFVIAGADGKTHSGDGRSLQDYYCYGKPVLSPVRGRVTQVIDDLPDNPIGATDRANNWGNLIVIQDYRGFYVEISHLMEKSARVKVGDSVERGMILGSCGNSGYSPQPHIHVQVQATEFVGGATLPFSFVGYAANGAFHANECPKEGEFVEPLYPDKRLDSLTAFVLDEEYEYSVRRSGREIERIKLAVKMAPDGTFYFDSGRGRLYFGKHEGTFYFYRVDGTDRWLRTMLLALPRLPLTHRARLTWCDYVPIGVASQGWRKIAAQFMSSFYPALSTLPAQVAFTDRNQAELTLNGSAFCTERRASVEFDDRKGFSVFKLDDIELRRIDREEH